MQSSVIEPPSQDNWVHSKKYVELLPSNTKIAYLELGSSSSSVIIFIHGLGDTSRSFSPIIKHFTSFHCYLLDLPGFGNSSEVTGPIKDLKDFLEDIVSFMNILKIPKAHFVGHSLGSHISQGMAMIYPDRVESISLLGTCIITPQPLLLEIYKRSKDFKEYPDEQFVEEWTTTDLPIDEIFTKYLKEETKTTKTNTWRSVLKGMLTTDFSLFTTDITCKTLIIHGTADSLFDEASQEEIRKKLPHASYISISSAGHNLHWEKPNEVAISIDNFLKNNK